MSTDPKARMGDSPRPGNLPGHGGSTGCTTPSDNDVTTAHEADQGHHHHHGEETPLLGRSRSTSPTTLSSLSTSSSIDGRRQRRRRRRIPEEDDNDDDDDDDDNDDDQDDNEAAQHPVSRLRAVCIALTMFILIWIQASNMSGMTMVQGHIAEDLDAYDEAMWFTSSYLIVVAAAAPLAGRLATVFPVRAMLLASACLFVLGAVVSAAARAVPVFLLGRAVAGLGGGSVITLSLILVFQLTTPTRRGLYVGAVNSAFTAGVATGAGVFGALLPVAGWRALFLLQAPVGLVAGLGVYLSVPDFKTTTPMLIKKKKKTTTMTTPSSSGSSRSSRSSKKDDGDGGDEKTTTLQKLKTIDYAGAVLLTTSIVLFLYGLAGTIQPLPMLLAALPLALFLLNEYRFAADPLIPLSVLQSRSVLLACLAHLGLMAARWTVLFYTPILFLAVRGLSPARAGAVLVPTNLGFGLGGLLVGWLHIKRAGSFWLPSLVSVACFGAALLGLSRTSTAAVPGWAYLALVFANGFCTGAAMNYTLAHLLHVSVPGTHYVATGLLTTFRGFAGSFGTSIGGGIFTRRLRAELAAGFARLDADANANEGGTRTGALLVPSSPPSLDRGTLIKRLVGSPNLVFGGSLSEAERQVAISGYEVSLRVLYTYAVGLIVLVLFLQAGTGWTAPTPALDEEAQAQAETETETETPLEEEFAEYDERMEA